MMGSQSGAFRSTVRVRELGSGSESDSVDGDFGGDVMTCDECAGEKGKSGADNHIE